MRVGNPFVLAGALWGLVLGACAGYAASAFVAGFAWLYLFGDATWPAWAANFILGAGLAVATAVVLAGLWLGVRFARRAKAAPEGERTRRQRRAWISVLAAALTAGAGLAVLAMAGLRDAHDRAQMESRYAFYETLRSEGQRIAEVASTTAPSDRSLRVDVATEGVRGGRYRLDWVLVAPGYDAVLVRGTREDRLAPGGNTLRVNIDAAEAIGAYREVALGGAEVNVEVDEKLRIELSLTPVLDGDDYAALPPDQQHNLKIGDSDLADHRAARIALRFAIRGGDYRLLE